MNRFGWNRVYCLLWVTAAAYLIDFGHIHSEHNADALVPIMVSIDRWQPFYWEQNRYGMFVPLLAMPARNPLHNLLVQNYITIWFGLLAFPLAARYFRVSRDWGLAGLLAAGTFLAIAPIRFLWTYLTTFSVFPTSLAFALGALILLDEAPTRRRKVAAAVLFGLAVWTNAAIGVALFFVVAAVALTHRRASEESVRDVLTRRDVVVQFAYCFGATLFSKALERIPDSDYYNTPSRIPYIWYWWDSLYEMAAIAYFEMDPAVWNWFILGCAFVVLGALFGKLPGSITAGRLLAGVTLGGVTYSTLMAIGFGGVWRYTAPAMVMTHAAAVVAALSAVGERLMWVRRGISLALLAVIPLRLGLPSIDTVRADLEARFGFGCDQIIEARCTHFAGEYWKVWPAMFMVNLRQYEEGSPFRTWGVTHRSIPTYRYWSQVPREETRIGVFLGDDKEAQRYLDQIGENWQVAEERAPIKVYVAK